MRRVPIILLNGATLLSTLLALATAILWVRSPSVFDRLSFTARSSDLWEFTSIWGDLAIVRADSWPLTQPTRWQSFPLGRDPFFPIADCEPLFTRDANNLHLEEWGRGFSHQSGVVTAQFEQLAQRFFPRRFSRWTLPLWLPLMLFAATLAARVFMCVRRRHRARQVARHRWPRLKAATRAIPTLLLLGILLLGWHSYWAAEQIRWNKGDHRSLVGAYRGILFVGGSWPAGWGRGQDKPDPLDPVTPPIAQPMNRTIPYEDVIGRIPDWDHTFRRTTRRFSIFIVDHFTLEPFGYDLSRDDIAFAFWWRFQLFDVSPTGFRYDRSGPFIAAPFWLFALTAAALPGLQLFNKIKRRWRQARGRCANCGYDLRATPARCPECGAMPPAFLAPPRAAPP